ncbi:response regulator transcription factor [Pantoea sp. B9002]|uniref:response regulator transcription factor n=1 Tax=Pantoea sp. B9002 TaxID=2726979 RepID=UPI0015A29F94|nr:response regulator transcription factor [Pantoea sp. B9002]NWA63445.1 response regulator transcription factor [Pantoea sp. B9002]
MNNNIFLIDKHPIMLHGYGMLFESRGFHTAGMTKIDNDFYDKVKLQEPAFIIIDCYQFPLETHAILQFVVQHEINSKIIALSECEHNIHQDIWMNSGIVGYMKKSQAPEKIFEWLLPNVKNGEYKQRNAI